LDGLRELKTELGQSWRTASGNIWVGGGLEGGQTGANNEERAAKATKGRVFGGGPEHQRTNAVDAEASDEGPSITPISDDPSGIRQWANEVGTEVSSLKTTSFGGCDVQCGLKFCVQDIEETVGETPQEEEDGDQTHRKERLSDCQCRGTGQSFVGNVFPLLVCHCIGGGRSLDIIRHDGVGSCKINRSPREMRS